jgi:hypothetical protein
LSVGIGDSLDPKRRQVPLPTQPSNNREHNKQSPR